MSSTLREVAQAAGVSVMSACAVLSGGGRNVRVSTEKAHLIREKAKELFYEPNLMGRGLRTRKTDTIGVVLQNLTTFGSEPYYYQQLLDGIIVNFRIIRHSIYRDNCHPNREEPNCQGK